MARKTDAPLANRLAKQLRHEHARGLGGIHAGAQGGGCPTCELLREAAAAGLIQGPWPSTIGWDGSILNSGGGGKQE